MLVVNVRLARSSVLSKPYSHPNSICKKWNAFTITRERLTRDALFYFCKKSFATDYTKLYFPGFV